MLGRFQRALHRGVLAGLQQQQCQQQCQQLEVLGLQATRGLFNDYKPSKTLPKKLKQLQRRAEAVQKVTSKQQQAEPAAAAAAGSNSSSSLDAVSTAVDASSSPSTAAAAAAAHSSGPVSSPLSRVPRAPGSSSSSAAAALAAAAAAGKKDSKSSWVPSWLDSIMEYPRRRRAPKPSAGTTSPLQSNAPDAAPAAADSKGSSKEDDGWNQLEKWRSMSMEDYQTSIANDPGSEGGERAPRPNKPANKGPNSVLRSRMDQYRVMHARYEQQSSLISIMDDEDKLRAKADPLAFMKDADAVARLARTAQTTTGAVMDLLFSYHKRRDFAELLLQHREAGKPMPLVGDQQAISELHAKLQMQRARREHAEVLKERMDPQNCQLRAWSKVVGKNRKCPRTDLPYKDCCGSQLGSKLARKALRQ